MQSSRTARTSRRDDEFPWVQLIFDLELDVSESLQRFARWCQSFLDQCLRAGLSCQNKIEPFGADF